MTRLFLLIVAACGTAPATPPRRAAVPQPSVPFTSDVVVIEADRLASSTPASPRVLRRIVAARRGNVELMYGYTELGVIVTRVVSGALFDPDYARRPIGVNHLEIVLVDEAAYAAPLMDDKVGGTWKLTQLADGTLVASAIEDTPWPASLVARRREAIARARSDLRSPLPERRLAGLDALEQHAFYELVPDVIAILDDGRSHGQPTPPPGRGGERVVGDVAERRLRKLVAPLGPAPPPRASPDVWATFWRDRTMQVSPPPVIVPTRRTEHIRLATSQSWPEFAHTPRGVAVAVSSLDAPLDGNTDGVFLVGPNKRTWLSRVVPEALDAVDRAVLYAERNASWLFKLVGDKPRDGQLFGRNRKAVYNTIASSSEGYLVLGIDDSKDLLATLLGNDGEPRIETRLLPLNDHPEVSYHRGVHPVGVARRARGWLAVVATVRGVVAVNITDGLQLIGTTLLANDRGIVQPKIAAGAERAIAMWTDSQTGVLAHVLLDLQGKPLAPAATTGSEVALSSRPVALADGGFAAAWIEAGAELHLGRWDKTGALVANVVVQARHVAPFTLQLQHEDAALVITYLDLSSYPYPLVSRRLALSDLR